MNWILAIFGLVFIVLIHELGHALAAYHCGVRIKKFSIGIGPGFNFRVFGGIKLIVSPFLIGGYVELCDEDFKLLTFWQRSYIHSAGMIVNVLAASVLLMFAGYSVLKALYVPLLFWLGGWIIILSKFGLAAFDPAYAVGPIGIVSELTTKIHDPNEFLFLLALVNIGVAMFNALPMPPFDGGLIAFDVLGKFMPAKIVAISRRVVTIVAVLGMLVLSIVVTYNDIIKLISVTK